MYAAAQLSVPIGELAAAVMLSNTRAAFGGAAQILPESEAPITAMRGRNAALIGSGTNSQAATLLLRNLPFTIDYTPDDRFAVLDQRKPAGQNVVFVSEPTGEPGLSTSYGLVSVITTAGSSGKPKRTLVISGVTSAGVLSVEFFSSASHLQQLNLKNRFAAAGLNGFPAVYQVIVRCRTSDVRLISYEYAGHEIVQRSNRSRALAGRLIPSPQPGARTWRESGRRRPPAITRDGGGQPARPMGGCGTPINPSARDPRFNALAFVIDRDRQESAYPAAAHANEPIEFAGRCFAGWGTSGEQRIQRREALARTAPALKDSDLSAGHISRTLTGQSCQAPEGRRTFT